MPSFQVKALKHRMGRGLAQGGSQEVGSPDCNSRQANSRASLSTSCCPPAPRPSTVKCMHSNPGKHGREYKPMQPIPQTGADRLSGHSVLSTAVHQAPTDQSDLHLGTELGASLATVHFRREPGSPCTPRLERPEPPATANRERRQAGAADAGRGCSSRAPRRPSSRQRRPRKPARGGP